MDLRRTFQRMLRIICAYAAVGMILLICLCVGLWSAFGSSFRATNEAFQNIFQRRRNVRFMESDDGTSKDELQTFPKTTNPPSDDTTSECTSSTTFTGPTETLNTEEKEATEKQTKNDPISTKDDFSNLEGLALQMVHLEQHRVSIDVHHRQSSSDSCVRSPNESLPVNVTSPKSVLKSSRSENKSPTSTRGTRRIRFQDEPIYEVSKGSSAAFTSPKVPPKQRKILSPAAYLKSGLDFQESPAKSSPAKSSETKTRITEQSPEAVQTENVSMINLSSGTVSNQKLANEETKSLAKESNSTTPTAFSSEIADNEQIANKSMDPLSEELNSTNLAELSSETADSQQMATESEDSLSVELNPPNPSILCTTNQQVSNKSIDFFSQESISTNSTSLSSEIATNQQIINESTDSLSAELDSTVPVAYKEFKDSPIAGDRCFEPERVESTSKCKSDEISLMEQTSAELSNQMKEMKIEELRYESSVKKTASSDEKEESFKKGDTEDISVLSEKSESVNDGESLQAMNLLSESATCQQSTEELINANLCESTLSDKLNPPFLKTGEEPCKSLKSEDQTSQEEEAYDDASQEMIAQTSNKRDVEKLSDDSSEREGIEHRPVKKPSKEGKKGR